LILVYHHVAPTDASPARTDPEHGWGYRHSPEGLERQLNELTRRGFRFVPLETIVAHIEEHGRAPAMTAAITFDDGWRDAHEHALPVLRKLGMTATFFVTTDHLRRGLEDPVRMSAAQLRELVTAGMSIGGHSRTHPDLTRVSEARAREEIAGCKADLEDVLGRSVPTFAYPRGTFNRRVVELTREAGYVAACSVLSPARNDRASLFWMFRDALSEPLNSAGDRYRLTPWVRRVFEWRVRRKLRAALR
jgi:peptidoglycan/xylan/chitin deacetylase (PgdA/CDA1 family)